MVTVATMKYADWLNLRMYVSWCYDGLTAKDAISSEVHASNSAWLVREGRARLTHGNKVYVAYPGQWLIAKPGYRLQEFEAGTRLLSISFNARWPDGSYWLNDGLSLVIPSENVSELEGRALPMVRCAERIGSGHWDIRNDRISALDYLSMENHLITWLVELIRVLNEHGVTPSAQYGVDERVSKAVALLVSHNPGEPLDQDWLARKTGLSLVHLVRLFQKDLNTTPKAYFNKLRLEYAIENLQVPGTRIGDLAAALGFSEISNFSNWFKKQVGRSPRDYKKRLQSPDYKYQSY